jgi:uroporphyrinogen decarboxylase
MILNFEPDYHYMLDVLHNRRPARLPMYEHIISPEIMEKILGVRFSGLVEGNALDVKAFFSHYFLFFR